MESVKSDKVIAYKTVVYVCDLMGAILRNSPKPSVNSLTNLYDTQMGGDSHRQQLMMAIQMEMQDFGLDEPSNVQSESWDIINSGRDLLSLITNGMDKGSAMMTSIFAPLFNRLMLSCNKDSSLAGGRKGPRALVIAASPQAVNEMEKRLGALGLLCFNGMTVGTLYWSTVDDLRAGIKSYDVVIGSPGRIAMLLRTKQLDVSGVEFVAILGVHGMSKLGLADLQKKVLPLLHRQNKQVFVTSEKWTPNVQAIAEEQMRDPLMLTIGMEEVFARDGSEPW
jgi:superfamily II DNA/RNA helicase